MRIHRCALPVHNNNLFEVLHSVSLWVRCDDTLKHHCSAIQSCMHIFQLTCIRVLSSVLLPCFFTLGTLSWFCLQVAEIPAKDDKIKQLQAKVEDLSAMVECKIVYERWVLETMLTLTEENQQRNWGGRIGSQIPSLWWRCLSFPSTSLLLHN